MKIETLLPNLAKCTMREKDQMGFFLGEGAGGEGWL